MWIAIHIRTYHTNFNKPISEENALGWTTHFVIDDVIGNLLSQSDAKGVIVTNAYDSRGLLLSSTDALGWTSQYTYDTNGFMEPAD